MQQRPWFNPSSESMIARTMDILLLIAMASITIVLIGVLIGVLVRVVLPG